MRQGRRGPPPSGGGVARELFEVVKLVANAQRPMPRRLTAFDHLKAMTLDPQNRVLLRQHWSALLTELSYALDENSSVARRTAALLGKLANLVTQQQLASFHQWVLTDVRANSSQRMTSLLASLKVNLEDPEANHQVPLINELCKGYLVFLGEVSEPRVFTSAVEFAGVLSSQHPDVFSAYFEATVDVMLGWCVFSTSTDNIRSTAYDFIMSSSHHWSVHTDYLERLVRTQLDHVENLVLHGRMGPRELSDADVTHHVSVICECFAKIAAASHSVKSVAEFFTLFSRIFSTSENPRQWTPYANQTVKFIAGHLGDELIPISEASLAFLHSQVEISQRPSDVRTCGDVAVQLLKTVDPTAVDTAKFDALWRKNRLSSHPATARVARLLAQRILSIDLARCGDAQCTFVNDRLAEVRKLLELADVETTPNGMESSDEDLSGGDALEDATFGSDKVADAVADEVALAASTDEGIFVAPNALASVPTLPDEDIEEKEPTTSHASTAVYNKRERESLIAFNLQLLARIPVDHPCLSNVIESLCGIISTYRSSAPPATNAGADVDVLPAPTELIHEQSIGSVGAGSEIRGEASARAASLTLMHQNSKLLRLAGRILHSWAKSDNWDVVSGADASTLSQLDLCLTILRSPACSGVEITNFTLQWMESCVRRGKRQLLPVHLSAAGEALEALCGSANHSVRHGAARCTHEIAKEVIELDELCSSSDFLARMSLCAMKHLTDPRPRNQRVFQRILEFSKDHVSVSKLGHNGWLANQNSGPGGKIAHSRAALNLPLSTSFKGPQFVEIERHLGAEKDLREDAMISILKVSHSASVVQFQQQLSLSAVVPTPITSLMTASTLAPQDTLTAPTPPEAKANISDVEQDGATKDADVSTEEDTSAIVHVLLDNVARDSHTALLWLASECAKYLVRTRLTTPLGGAMKLLEHLSSLLKGDKLRGKKRHRWHASHLLLLLDLLEKFMMNATLGSLTLTPADPNSELFFTTRRKAGKQFFAQVRPLMLDMSIQIESPALIVANGQKHLAYLAQSVQDKLKKQTGDAKTLSSAEDCEKLWRKCEETLFRVGSALVELQEPDHIEGIRVWFSSAFAGVSTETSSTAVERWLSAMRAAASGCFEEGVRQLDALLRDNSVVGSSSNVVDDPKTASAMCEEVTCGLTRLVYEWYMSLGDWTSLGKWLGETDAMNVPRADKEEADEDAVAKSLYSDEDRRLVKLLSKFDEGDLDAVKLSIDDLKLDELASKSALTDPFSVYVNDMAPHHQSFKDKLEMFAIASVADFSGKLTSRQRDIHHGLRVALREPMKLASMDFTEHYMPFVSQLQCVGALSQYEKHGLESALRVISKSSAPSLNADGVNVPMISSISADAGALRLRDEHLLRRTREHLFRLSEASERKALPSSLVVEPLLNLARHARVHDNLELCSSTLSRAESLAGEDDELSVLLALEGKISEFQLTDKPSLRDAEEFSRFLSLFKLAHSIGDSSPVMKAHVLMVIVERFPSIPMDVLSSHAQYHSWSGDKSLFESIDKLKEAATPQEALLRQSVDLSPASPHSRLKYGTWCFERIDEMAMLNAHDRASQSKSPSAALPEALVEPLPELQEILEEAKAFGVDLAEVALTTALAGVYRSLLSSELHLDMESDFDALSVRVKAELKSHLPTEVFHSLEKASTVLQSLVKLCIENLRKLNSFVRVGTQNYFASLQNLKAPMRSQRSTGATSRQSLPSQSASMSYAMPYIDPSFSVNASLRVFSVLTSMHNWNRELLATAFEATPTRFWKFLLPQLFSRLSHPSAFVREQIEMLISRIAVDNPSSVVFPVLVGMETADGDHPQLMSVLNQIRTTHSKMVEEIEKMLSELNRIAILWDDDWHVKMQQISASIPGRIKLLTDEIKLIQGDRPEEMRRLSQDDLDADVDDFEEDVSTAEADASSETFDDQETVEADEDEEEEAQLIFERYQIAMAPILEALAELEESTVQRSPQTPHEINFQRKYSRKISAILRVFRFPQHPEEPMSVWKTAHQMFKELIASFPRSRWDLAEISPYLNRITSSGISIDGMENAFGDSVEIASMRPNVEILRSKTRPKKLVFMGTDGKQYQYILKAREDLHLDQRIMQFLTTTNRFLSSPPPRASPSTPPSHRELRARTYAVVPLPNRCGLIRFVDHALALFDLVKHWQEHQKQAAQHASAAASKKALMKGADPSAERKKQDASAADDSDRASLKTNSEAFNARVRELLVEAKLSANLPRKEWPLSVLKRAFRELSARVPDNLIQAQLWYSSVGFQDMLMKTTVFARSVAVMSMVGYVIGLGDRHLGNILVDFHTGEMVHIDYNVCFDKGLKLRIPEVVPFRLTKTVRAAMGLTGVEGNFRAACEETLSTLRHHRYSMLELLSTFVYDPLGEWLDSSYGESLRREMEMRTSLNRIATKIDNSKDVLRDVFAKYRPVLTKLHGLFREVQMLTLARDHPSGHTVVQRLDAKGNIIVNPAHLNLHQLATECGLIADHLETAMGSVQHEITESSYMQQIARGASSSVQLYFQTFYLQQLCDTVVDDEDRDALVPECAQVDSDMAKLCNEHTSALADCVDSLVSYSYALNNLQHKLYSTAIAYPGRWRTLLRDITRGDTISMPKLKLFQQEVNTLLSAQPADPDAIRALEKAFIGEVDATTARVTQNAQIVPNMAHMLVPSIPERQGICEQMSAQMNVVLGKLSQFSGERVLNLASLRLVLDWDAKLVRLTTLPAPDVAALQLISLNGDIARESPIECVNLITESYLRLVALCQQKIGSMSFSAIAASLGGKQVTPYRGVYFEDVIQECLKLGRWATDFDLLFAARVPSFVSEWHELDVEHPSFVATDSTNSVEPVGLGDVCPYLDATLTSMLHRCRTALGQHDAKEQLLRVRREYERWFAGAPAETQDIRRDGKREHESSSFLYNNSLTQQALPLLYDIDQVFALFESKHIAFMKLFQAKLSRPGWRFAMDVESRAMLEVFFVEKLRVMLTLVCTMAQLMRERGEAQVMHPDVSAARVEKVMRPLVSEFVHNYCVKLLCNLVRTAFDGFGRTQSEAQPNCPPFPTADSFNQWLQRQHPIKQSVTKVYESVATYFTAYQHLASGELLIKLAEKQATARDPNDLRVAQLSIAGFQWYHDDVLQLKSTSPLPQSRSHLLVRIKQLVTEHLAPMNVAMQAAAVEFGAIEQHVMEKLEDPEEVYEQHGPDPSGVETQLREGLVIERLCHDVLEFEEFCSQSSAYTRDLAQRLAIVCEQCLTSSVGDDGSECSPAINSRNSETVAGAGASRHRRLVSEDLRYPTSELKFGYERARDSQLTPSGDRRSSISSNASSTANDDAYRRSLDARIEHCLVSAEELSNGQLLQIESEERAVTDSMRPLLNAVYNTTTDANKFHGMANALKRDMDGFHESIASIAAESTLSNWNAQATRSSVAVGNPGDDVFLSAPDRIYQQIRTFWVSVHQSLRSGKFTAGRAAPSTGRTSGATLDTDASSQLEGAVGSTPLHSTEANTTAASASLAEMKTQPNTDAASQVSQTQPADLSEAHEKPNKHGLAVLKRVREKLEGWIMPNGSPVGRVSGDKKPRGENGDFPASTLTVTEQVDLLIREATKDENLCRLYEGWAAWV